MKLFRGAVDTIKRVYRYEKTTGMDVGALQGVMLIFAVVLFLIDIENFRLGKYVIGIVTLVVGIDGGVCNPAVPEGGSRVSDCGLFVPAAGGCHSVRGCK